MMSDEWSVVSSELVVSGHECIISDAFYSCSFAPIRVYLYLNIRVIRVLNIRVN